MVWEVPEETHKFSDSKSLLLWPFFSIYLVRRVAHFLSWAANGRRKREQINECRRTWFRRKATMSSGKHISGFRRIPILALLVSSVFGGTLSGRIIAQENRRSSPAERHQKRIKVSRTLATQAEAADPSDDTTGVILQLSDQPSGKLVGLLNRNGIHVKGRFQNLNAFAVELPLSAINELASFEEVEFLSQDAVVEAQGHLSLTTGADAVRQQVDQYGANYMLNGTGVGIAVLDSGMDMGHKSFSPKRKSRIVYSRDFTNAKSIADPYGHGTHVASLAAGNIYDENPSHEGIASNANLINLRVLNRNGSGSVSNVLSALDWVMANRMTYNIRVVNLSLGTRAVDSYLNDPLCKSVRRLVDAGIVVVAAAGNDGKDDSGNKVYGQIHSPGNEPSVITVGASNTFGTDGRGDDVVATYSSRGPTRSFSTDPQGVTRFDNLIKPDLVAPGNKLIAAESDDNRLVTSYPELNAFTSNRANSDLMYLSGTSMAAPVVAGAAALMLQANPKLTPNLVKSIMMYTAQQLPAANIFEQGAGQLNIEGAVRLATLVRTDLASTTPIGAPLLTTSALPLPETAIADLQFPWATRINMSYGFASGSNLITKFQKIYGLGMVLGDGIILNDGIILGDNHVISDGIILGDGIILSDGIILGDGLFISDGIILGDGIARADGITLAKGIILGDNRIKGTAVFAKGDDTICMK